MLTNFLTRKDVPSNANDALQDNRPEVLKQFDDFNTADTAQHGIMGGILEEQLRESADREAFDRYRSGEREKPATQPREGGESKQRDFNDYYAPLNSSIQSMQDQHKRETAALRDQISRMEQMVRNGYQQQQQPQQEQYDPNEYVNFGHLKTTEKRLAQAEQYIWQQAMRNEFNRANIEYMQFKQANPSFSTSQEELVDAFNKYANGDPNRVANINWQGVFSQSHLQREAPTLREENEKLKKEIESLKRGGSGPSRTTRNNATPETQPVSPALRSSGRTVATAPGQENNVVNFKTFRQVGNFKGYANDLKRSGFLGQQ